MSTSTLTQTLQQAGTLIGPPCAWTAGNTSATATAIMADSDAANSGNVLNMYIAASYDAQGLSYLRESSFGWQGGPNGGNTPPVIGWSPDPNRPPTFTRVEYDLQNSVSIGATLVNA